MIFHKEMNGIGCPDNNKKVKSQVGYYIDGYPQPGHDTRYPYECNRNSRQRDEDTLYLAEYPEKHNESHKK